jgi:Protein of unknown function (DUF4054)
MGAIAAFSYDWFNALYPEFSNLTEVQANSYWKKGATLYWRNDGRGPVQDADQQALILMDLAAHLAFLSVGTANGPSAASQGLVGRVSSASQGSVSLSTDAAGAPGSASWFLTSPYGYSFWQATLPFRLGGHYRPGPQRWFGVGYPGIR